MHYKIEYKYFQNIFYSILYTSLLLNLIYCRYKFQTENIVTPYESLKSCFSFKSLNTHYLTN